MRRFLSGALALILAAALSLSARAAASAEIIRAFVYGETLYTYMTVNGTEKPVTKAEAKIGGQTLPAAGRLETVRQAGSPVTYLLLVDNSNSMPAFRQEAENFAESLAHSGGADTRFILASFGDAFAVAGEDVPAGELAEEMAKLPLDEKVTRLHTAISQALDWFEEIPRAGNELRCMVVLSDGVQYDPSGGIPYEELLEQVEHSGVMLHSVGLGDDAPALENLGTLAAASGGTHQVLGGENSAQAAGAALADTCGNLIVTGFDLSGRALSGGPAKVSVTLSSGGELLCRAEAEVELPETEGTAESISGQPLPDPGPSASGGQQADALTAEPAAPETLWRGGLVWIAPAAILAFAALILVLVLLLHRRKAAPTAGEEHMPGIYMRLELLRGGLAEGQKADAALRDELIIGSSPACDFMLAGDGIAPRHARVLLSGGMIYLEDLGSPSGTFVNGVPVTAPAALRSGDEIGVGSAAFRLKF